MLSIDHSYFRPFVSQALPVPAHQCVTPSRSLKTCSDANERIPSKDLNKRRNWHVLIHQKLWCKFQYQKKFDTPETKRDSCGRHSAKNGGQRIPPILQGDTFCKSGISRFASYVHEYSDVTLCPLFTIWNHDDDVECSLA